MKNLVIYFIIFLALIAGKANATNLRGQIVRNIGGRYYPVANARVDLMVWNGGTWVPGSYAITGADGFYYFMNFQPGATFCISFSGRFYPAKPIQILSLPPQNYQDLPVISE